MKVSTINNLHMSNYPNLQKFKAVEPEKTKKDSTLSTDGTKKILGGALAVAVAGFFAYMIGSTVKMKSFINKSLKEITDPLDEALKKNVNKAMDGFSDWQKKDFIDAFRANKKNLENGEGRLLDTVKDVLNKTKAKDAPEIGVGAKDFGSLFADWFGE